MKKDILTTVQNKLKLNKLISYEDICLLCDEIVFLRSTLLKITKKENKQTFKVFCQKWLETERGFGQRSDGVTIHLTMEDHKKYCKNYWNREKERNSSGYVPDEYTRESGNPFEIFVSKAVYDKINKSENKTIWISDKEFNEIEKENK